MTNKKGNWITTLTMIIPYLIIIGIAQLIAFYLMGVDIMGGIPKTTVFQDFVVMLFTTVGSFLAVWCFTRYIEQRNFDIIGLKIGGSFFKEVLLGLCMPLIVFLVGFSILSSSQQIYWQIDKEIEVGKLLLSAAIFILVSLTEEIFARGYLFGNLLTSLNKWLALAISSIVFAAFHLANSNMNWLSFLNLFLAGILLGLPYLFTRSLWFSIVFHFGWNFFQGTILGFNVSGQSEYSLILQKRIESNVWNGGEFGFEASVLAVIFQIICIILLYMFFKKKPSLTPVNPKPGKSFKTYLPSSN